MGAGEEARALLWGRRWGALATCDGEGPLASMVAYAVESESGGLLMFLSGLAAHSRALDSEPRCSLVVAEEDPGAGDPQTLARLTVRGEARRIERDTAGFDAAWAVYAARFPSAASRLALADFQLYRLAPGTVRYVGGFARAATLSAAELTGAGRA